MQITLIIQIIQIIPDVITVGETINPRRKYYDL